MFAAVVSIGVLTWLKSVNYVTADALAADAIALGRQGDAREGIRLLLKASTRAPDVQTYYLDIARMFDELVGTYSSGDAQSRAALGSRFYSRAAVRANELDPGARAAQANASITLGLQGDPNGFDEAIELSEAVVAMMPNFAVSHYALALPHLLRGDADQGLNPNPPKDTDGRREDSGRGWVRELQGRWPGVLG